MENPHTGNIDYHQYKADLREQIAQKQKEKEQEK